VMENPKPASMTVPEAAALLAELFTCPMASHAHVVTDKPGKCPECEMDLVRTSTVKHQQLAEDNWRKQHPPGHQL